MDLKEVAEYFKRVCKESKTFELDSWIDEKGNPIISDSRSISNPNTSNISKLNQSLFLAENALHMGISGGDDDDISNDAIDLSYYYDSSEIHINYCRSDIDIDKNLNYIFPLLMLVDICETEEMHFQDSLVYEKYFTFEEEKCMQKFFEDIRKFNIPLIGNRGNYE